MSSTIKALVIAGLVLGILSGIATTIYKYETDPERVLNNAVPSMVAELAVSGWNAPTLMKYSTPEFQQWLLDNKLNKGMPGFSYLGKEKKFLGIPEFTVNDDQNFAILKANFQFEAGPGSLTIQMAKRQQKWLIYSFSLDSRLFKKPVAEPSAP